MILMYFYRVYLNFNEYILCYKVICCYRHYINEVKHVHIQRVYLIYKYMYRTVYDIYETSMYGDRKLNFGVILSYTIRTNAYSSR